MMKFLSRFFLIAFFILFSCEDNKNEEKFVIEFSPASEYDFGKVEINKSASTKIRIKNSDESSGPFTGTIEIEDSPAFYSSFTGIIELQKNESKEIYITFTPSAEDNYAGKLVIKNDKNFNEFYLSGLGASPVSFSVTPSILNFGLVIPGSSKDLDLVVNNEQSSGFDLDITLDLPVGDFSMGGITTFTLSPNTSKTLTVRYTPTQNTASKVLQINHNSSTIQSPLKVSLSGVKDISAEIADNIDAGWSLFLSKSYLDGKQKFQDAINASRVSTVYDSMSNEAKNGRAWSALFAQETSDFARVSFVDFNSISGSGIKLSTDSKTDVLAGIAISGVLINAQTSTGYYTNVVSSAEQLLAASPNYEFSYNSNINYKDVRYALIQAFFNLSDFTKAANQLDILVPANAPHSSTAEELLIAIQALAGQL